MKHRVKKQTLFNKIKNVFENEDTQEREAFLQAREDVDQSICFCK